MTSQFRIRLARRHAGLSQTQLAKAACVQRSAVSHWESSKAKNPSVDHLRAIALVTGVQFEWLVTGRGEMALCNEIRLDSIATAEALLVEDTLELRLLRAFREGSSHARVSLVEIAEQLASQRIGRSAQRSTQSSAAQHGLRTGLQRIRRTGETQLG